MSAAFTCSRRKISSNVRITDVVPAPEEPVITMIGCLTDMVCAPYRSAVGAEEAARTEQLRVADDHVVVVTVVLLGYQGINRAPLRREQPSFPDMEHRMW